MQLTTYLHNIFQRKEKYTNILPKFKNDKHRQHLNTLQKISQSVDDIEFFYTPTCFREILLQKISNATHRICIVTLYLEKDEAGRSILDALYTVKRQRPELYIYVLVDWHRAQRGRFGTTTSYTNADWYFHTAKENSDIDIPIFGIPVHTREVFGVLHFKSFIIDDSLLYSGANINNIYLCQINKYRYDRYHFIRNAKMTNIMFNWIEQNLIHNRGAHRLNDLKQPKNSVIKSEIRIFRQELRNTSYHFQGDANNEQLSVIPLVGLGKSSLLNKTISHLISYTEKKLTICTPYFNLPMILMRKIITLLQNGKKVEIITGDKTANDFFIPEDQPFKVIGILPYLYETNLRCFLNHLQHYTNNNQLTIRLWKDKDNSYHLKGIWVDGNWTLLTGNNLNPRSWYLDLENAILIYDPNYELVSYRKHELDLIRTNTTIIHHYRELQSISNYPMKIRKLIRSLHHTYIDRIIKRIL